MKTTAEWAAVCAMAIVPFALSAEVPVYTGPVAAEELHLRDGIGHVMEKVRNGGPITVAYLGGSITEMTGWRNLTTDWLRSRYPACTFAEVNAGLGGTGSDLGCYRLQQDALSANPDLLFVEFATNDYEAEPTEIWRNFEGIIRQTWRKNPKTDIIFVYTIGEKMLELYKGGHSPQAASAMEQIATFYGIPSIDFGPRVAREEIDRPGYLVWDTGVIAIAVPADTPDYDDALNAELAKEGKFLFSKDKVHPAMPGHRTYYLESIKAAWSAMEELQPRDNAAKLSSVFYDAVMEKAKMVTIEESMLSGVWRKDDVYNKNFGSYAWISDTPGSKMKLRFNGSRCDLYTFEAPPCGQLLVTVDGVRQGDPLPLFSKWGAKGWHRAAERLFDGQSGLHEIELELDSKQPALKDVFIRAGSLSKDLIEQYARTECYLGRLLMVGDVEPQPDDLPNSAQWFDANISQYVRWPESSVFAMGGTWNAETAALADVASLSEKGVLEVDAAGRTLDFLATKQKTLGVDAGGAVFESVLNSELPDPDCLPSVDPSWKCGALVVREAGGLVYYGLAKDGEANVWTRLDGPAPSGESVRLTMTLRKRGARRTVRYTIDGIDYTVNGKADILVACADELSGVAIGGEGKVRSLAATKEPKPGATIFVR